jgi:hypothetical protein
VLALLVHVIDREGGGGEGFGFHLPCFSKYAHVNHSSMEGDTTSGGKAGSTSLCRHGRRRFEQMSQSRKGKLCIKSCREEGAYREEGLQ